MPGPCGDNFGKTYPTKGSIEKGKWYNVTMSIKSNTGNQVNGHVKITINREVVIDQDIHWTINDNERLIKSLFFHTFRGGKGDQWKSNTDSYIYYDNLFVQKLN